MHILVIDNHSLHHDELSKLLEGHQVDFVDYTECQFKELHYDVVILSGSHELPFYADSYAKELAFIQSTTLPVIGICLGCQLVAHAYGATIHREEAKIQGVHEIKDLRTHNIYKVYEGHSFCITDLGKELEGIAVSENCYEIIKHTNKPQR